MSDAKHDFLVKVIAVGIVLAGIIHLFRGAGADAGVFGILWHWAFSLFLVGTGVGFWRYRGWAFLTVSALLLVGWLVLFIAAIVALDAGKGDHAKWLAIWWVVDMIGIAYLGRWSMERRFRPHLDAGH